MFLWLAHDDDDDDDDDDEDDRSSGRLRRDVLLLLCCSFWLVFIIFVIVMYVSLWLQLLNDCPSLDSMFVSYLHSVTLWTYMYSDQTPTIHDALKSKCCLKGLLRRWLAWNTLHCCLHFSTVTVHNAKATCSWHVNYARPVQWYVAIALMRQKFVEHGVFINMADIP